MVKRLVQNVQERWGGQNALKFILSQRFIKPIHYQKPDDSMLKNLIPLDLHFILDYKRMITRAHIYALFYTEDK